MTLDVAPYAIVARANTTLSNGTILLTDYPHGSKTSGREEKEVYADRIRPSYRVILGREGQAFRRDLNGKEIKARNQGGGLFQASDKFYP